VFGILLLLHSVIFIINLWTEPEAKPLQIADTGSKVKCLNCNKKHGESYIVYCVVVCGICVLKMISQSI